MLGTNQVRTYPCPKCTKITSTSSERCKHCGTLLDPHTAAQAADREEYLISMEHDAKHAVYLVQGSLVMYALLLALMFYRAIGQLKYWGYLDVVILAKELFTLLAVGVVLMLPFIGISLWNILRWRKAFGVSRYDDDRAREARGEWVSACRQWAVLVLLYVLLDAFPTAYFGLGVL
jgi:hypothetical protein